MMSAILKIYASGVLFRNLARLGSLSLGVPRDFISINSGLTPPKNIFASLLAFWNFLALCHNRSLPSGACVLTHFCDLLKCMSFRIRLSFRPLFVAMPACGWGMNNYGGNIQ